MVQVITSVEADIAGAEAEEKRLRKQEKERTQHGDRMKPARRCESVVFGGERKIWGSWKGKKGARRGLVGVLFRQVDRRQSVGVFFAHARFSFKGDGSLPVAALPERPVKLGLSPLGMEQFHQGLRRRGAELRIATYPVTEGRSLPLVQYVTVTIG